MASLSRFSRIAAAQRANRLAYELDDLTKLEGELQTMIDAIVSRLNAVVDPKAARTCGEQMYEVLGDATYDARKWLQNEINTEMKLAGDQL